jgi:hypothetical protein
MPSGISVMKDCLAGIVFAVIHHLGQSFALFRIQQLKDRDLADHGYGC